MPPNKRVNTDSLTARLLKTFSNKAAGGGTTENEAWEWARLGAQGLGG